MRRTKGHRQFGQKVRRIEPAALVALRRNDHMAGVGTDADPSVSFARQLPAWRDSLLGGAAAGVLFLATGGVASANNSGCTVSDLGATVSCFGNQADGIGVTDPVTTLNINNLITGITPASGIDGISYVTQGPAFILSNTTPYAISVEGLGADGIYVRSSDEGSVTIEQTGDITSANGMGLYGWAQGAVSETTTGSIQSDLDGIHLESHGGGTVSVDHVGNITSNSGDGVYTWSQGVVSVAGDIAAGKTGIYAHSTDSPAVTVIHVGDITANDGDGIEATAPNGAVTVTNTGVIHATGDGIDAEDNSSQPVVVDQTGEIYAGGHGINAYSALGTVTVRGTGDIQSDGAGVYAASASNEVAVNQTGNIIAYDGAGIVVQAPSGSATLTGSGTIESEDDGISITTSGNHTSVGIERSGDIVSHNGGGIYATASTGVVDIMNQGAITAEGTGIYAESLGSNTSVTVSQGGDISSYEGASIWAGASQGSVSVYSTGFIQSEEAGIFAHNAGYGTVTVEHNGDIAAYHGTGVDAFSADGTVNVTVNGTIQAQHDGIDAANTGDGESAVDVTLAGSIYAYNGAGIYANSTGGDVSVRSADDYVDSITAAGPGIYAHSTGGASVNVDYVGDIASLGNGGIDAFSSTGAVPVTTRGNIQSALTGIVAANTSNGGDVTVNHTGNIASTDDDAINASSSNGNVWVTTNGDITGGENGIHVHGYGDLNVTVNGGTVQGGTTGSGVYFEQGYINSLTNYGTITNADGIHGYAIAANQNDTAINNYGTVIGNVELSDWTNSFYNYQGATFDMGTTVHLGEGNTLTNDGTLSPGGLGLIGTTQLTGSLANSSMGTLLADVDLQGSTIDRIDVSGNASLDGNLGLHFTSFSMDPQTLTLLTTGGTITTQDLSLPANPILSAYLTYPGSTEADLTIDGFNFAPDGLARNAPSIGKYLNGSLTNSTGLDPIALGLINLGSLGDVDGALNQLSPDLYLANETQALYSATDFADSLLIPSFIN